MTEMTKARFKEVFTVCVWIRFFIRRNRKKWFFKPNEERW